MMITVRRIHFCFTHLLESPRDIEIILGEKENVKCAMKLFKKKENRVFVEK